YKVNMFSDVINNIIQIHSNDYERLWNTISQTDKKILIALATKNKVNSLPLPTSTVYSGIKRLITKGYLIKTETVQFDDPFFKQWLLTNLL
ncbi:MAG: hypothetical protein LBR28_07225, partial [Bacteroidales bacterium]|nr:hypothetical protein [Bacteroidales bacterium]